eukprot:m.1538133 g.1538133  ORF g.1538133 m.1538133 type:complete len:484 (-) comp25245_c0_seq48:9020-10471(-)
MALTGSGLTGSVPSSPSVSQSTAMAEAISVHITGTRRVQEKMRTVVYFCIELGFHEIYWSLELRYSQFLAMHKEFDTLVPIAQKTVFPPKKVVNTNPVFIETRRQQLETWLDGLLQHPEAFSNADLHAMLQTPSTAMVWVRQHIRDGQRRSEHAVAMTTTINNMLFVDIEPRGDRQAPQRDPAGADGNGACVHDIDRRPHPGLIVPPGSPLDALHLVSPHAAFRLAAMHHAVGVLEAMTAPPTPARPGSNTHASGGDAPGIDADAATGAHAIGAVADVCTPMLCSWLQSEPLVQHCVPPAALPLTREVGRNKRKRTGPSTFYRNHSLAPTWFTVAVKRSPAGPDGAFKPIEVVLSNKTEYGVASEYCTVVELPHDDPLFNAGILTGDQIAAIDGRSVLRWPRDAVLEALQDRGDSFQLSFLRPLDVKTLEIEATTLDVSLVTDEDVYTGAMVHKLRRVVPTGAGARAGVVDGDILLQVGTRGW